MKSKNLESLKVLSVKEIKKVITLLKPQEEALLKHVNKLINDKNILFD